MDGLMGESSEEEVIRDTSSLTKKQKEQYNRHQAVFRELREQKFPHYLFHVLMALRED